MPRLHGVAAEGAPAIAAISDVAFPSETLVITGENLEGAWLRIWADGRLVDIEPLRTRHNRMQAVVPGDVPVSTVVVWPVRGEMAGAPIRVNGATAWWGWPARAKAGVARQTVRIFGKNLSLDGTSPGVYLSGPGTDTWLEVIGGNPYHIEAPLPDDLDEGTYRLWAHNGTGGQWGWSEPVSLEVVAVAREDNLPTFHVDDFGAPADDGGDDWAAITAAIRSAKQAGGGVRFARGQYHVSRALIVDGDGPWGIHLVGSGMGQHTWANAPAPDDHKVLHRVAGDHTLIAPVDGCPSPKDLIQLRRRYSSIRDMTVLTHADDGKQRCLTLLSHDIVLERVRAIVVDERPWFNGWGMPEEDVTQSEYKRRLQDEGATRIDAPGKANIVIRKCEFHHPGAGIDTPPLGAALRHAPGGAVCPTSTDYIQIVECLFRGYFDGRLEPYLKDRRFQAWRGWHNMAWVNNNCRNVIVERCDIAGADKANFKVTTRSLNHRNTSIRELYLANNRVHDVAPTSKSPGYHENKGEQFLFHLMYPEGGLFDVVGATDDSVTVDPTDPKYAPVGRHPNVAFNGLEFGCVPADVDANPSHLVAFVCAGLGVGQYRVIAACRRHDDGKVTLQLQAAWRVAPDATSRITLNAAYRRIILYGNEIDGGDNDPAVKSHGVTYWANSFENIIANNTFRNLTGGVVINSFYRCPTGWNLTRDNRIECIHGNGGDTVFPGRAAFCVDHVRVLDPPRAYRVWYTVGNVFRSNRCSDGDVIAFLHRPDYSRIDPAAPYLPEATRALLSMPRGDNTVFGYSYPDTPNGGIMMSVIENNRFEGARDGIVVSSPVNWLLLRNNTISLRNPREAVILDEGEERRGARDILVL